MILIILYITRRSYLLTAKREVDPLVLMTGTGTGRKMGSSDNEDLCHVANNQ